MGGGCVVFESLEEAVRGADVIVTVTLTTEPIIRGQWVKTGAVLCCESMKMPMWLSLYCRNPHCIDLSSIYFRCWGVSARLERAGR